MSASLKPYTTKQAMSASLKPYTTKQAMSASLKPYTTKQAMSASLKPYTTKQVMSASLKPYTTKQAMSASLEPQRTMQAMSASLTPQRTNQAMSSSLKPHTTKQAKSTSLKPHAIKRSWAYLSQNAHLLEVEDLPLEDPPALTCIAAQSQTPSPGLLGVLPGMLKTGCGWWAVLPQMPPSASTWPPLAGKVRPHPAGFVLFGVSVLPVIDACIGTPSTYGSKFGSCTGIQMPCIACSHPNSCLPCGCLFACNYLCSPPLLSPCWPAAGALH
eukprot:1161943-Pelagomonas_calceolata.AAC.2